MFKLDRLTDDEFQLMVLCTVSFKSHLEQCLNEEGFFSEEQAAEIENFIESIDALSFKVKQIMDSRSTLQ